MPVIRQRMKHRKQRSKGKNRSRNANRESRRQELPVRQQVQGLLAKLEKVSQDKFNERELVSLDVITEASIRGIPRAEHLPILKKILRKVSESSEQKKKSA